MFDKKVFCGFFTIETRKREINFFYVENEHDYLTNCFIKTLFGIRYLALGNYNKNLFSKK